MKKQELYKYVIDYFQKTLPDAQSELEYGNAYELLVSVILSAQCTDKRVNKITPSLLFAWHELFSIGCKSRARRDSRKC